MSEARDLETFMQQLARREETGGLPHPDIMWAKAELRRQWQMRQDATRWIRRAQALGSAICVAAAGVVVWTFRQQVANTFAGWNSLAALAALLFTAACFALAWGAARPPRRSL